MISEDKAQEKLKKLANEINVDLNQKQLKTFIKYYNQKKIYILSSKNYLLNKQFHYFLRFLIH